MLYFNPRSLAGATFIFWRIVLQIIISIHAPSRERQYVVRLIGIMLYFNPRSLAGATFIFWRIVLQIIISIHAPSRERLTTCLMCSIPQNEFQSTLPRGSDIRNDNHSAFVVISIHAPSRERPVTDLRYDNNIQFQSTLPRGSDLERPSAL